MGRSKTAVGAAKSTAGSALVTDSSSAFDPVLAALFASSAGPVTVPVKKNRSTKAEHEAGAIKSSTRKARHVVNGQDFTTEASSDSTEEETTSASEDEVQEHLKERPRKRRRVDQDEDLEGRYLDKLIQEGEREEKQRKRDEANGVAQSENDAEDDTSSDTADSDLNSDLEDVSDSEDEGTQKPRKAGHEEDLIPIHESLNTSAADTEASRSRRTVFLGNVSNSVIKSKSAKKALILHLRSAIDEKHHEKVESIRFRSTAFVQDAGPKRAAFAKKELMEETMQSTNAYVVLNTDAAARKVARKLNGSVLLDRHLRADHLGNPTPHDHRRCVFVGNLSFTDEATSTEQNEDGETKKRKRARDPADVEEGLWRTFGKCGKVESVRVIRDKETRISKGFAYVQFYDENAVESALLLNEKKFPPMLPRVLRVSRAKKDGKKQRPNTRGPEKFKRGSDQANTGRDKGLKAGVRRMLNGGTRDRPVFEGHRASNTSLPKGVKKLNKRPTIRPTNRSSKRAAAFKAGGGKKKRDSEA